MDADLRAAIEQLDDAERLAAGYAPRSLRAAYRALLALDALLRRTALSAREPLPAQIKLAWWREACAGLPGTRGHPVLAALANHWRGELPPLVALVDAWEEVAVGSAAVPSAEALARQRGAALEACAGEPPAAALAAARCWTLVELAHRAADPATRAAMLTNACESPPMPLPRTLRPLAVLAGLARRSGMRGGGSLLGDRLSPLAAIRLGIFGR